MDITAANEIVLKDLTLLGIAEPSEGGLESRRDAAMILRWIHSFRHDPSTLGIPKAVNFIDDYFEYSNESKADRIKIYTILDQYTENLGG